MEFLVGINRARYLLTSLERIADYSTFIAVSRTLQILSGLVRGSVEDEELRNLCTRYDAYLELYNEHKISVSTFCKNIFTNMSKIVDFNGGTKLSIRPWRTIIEFVNVMGNMNHPAVLASKDKYLPIGLRRLCYMIGKI